MFSGAPLPRGNISKLSFIHVSSFLHAILLPECWGGARDKPTDQPEDHHSQLLCQPPSVGHDSHHVHTPLLKSTFAFPRFILKANPLANFPE